MKINTWKDASYHVPLGKCKQWNIAIYLLEWPQFEHWQHQILVRIWSKRNSHSQLWECKMVQLLRKIMCWLLTKLNVPLNNSAVTLLGIPQSSGIETYSWMFRVSIFSTTKTWRQPKCPSVGANFDKLQYIQTMEYY